MAAERFCLRWNDFESNLSTSFREIRDDGEFFDLTLSVGDQQVQAHKLVLSACSPFFRSVLKQNPHQHPLLYLKGVTFGDLTAILNFIYHGEVSVAHDALNSFLTVAEELRIKGLSQNRNSNGVSSGGGRSGAAAGRSSNVSGAGSSSGGNISGTPTMLPSVKKSEALSSKGSSRSHPKDPDGLDPPSKKHKAAAAAAAAAAGPSAFPSFAVTPESFSGHKPQPPPEEEVDYEEVLPIKQELDGGPPPQDLSQSHRDFDTKGSLSTVGTVAEIDSYAEEYDYAGYGDGEEYDSSMLGEVEPADQSKGLDTSGVLITCPDDPSKFECSLCGSVFSYRNNATRHIKSAHFSEPIPCIHCGKYYKNERGLKDHIRSNHNHNHPHPHPLPH